MTTQDELLVPISTQEERKRLQPATVIIKGIDIETVGKKNAKKAVFSCIHPDHEDLIKISSVKWLKGDKLEETGLWYNRDDEGIQKGSALAGLIVAKKKQNMYGLLNESIETVLGQSGYLCFKNY